MSIRAFSGLVDDGKEVKIGCAGNMIYCRSASAQILVTAHSLRNNAGGNVLADKVPLTSRQVVYTRPGSFDQIIVRNESGGQVDFELIAGFGDYNAPLSQVALSVPSITRAGANVTADAVGVQLLPANANRKVAWVCVDPTGTNECIVAESQAAAAAGTGLPLSPGIAYPVESTSALWVARLGGADQTVYVLETEFA